MLIELSVLGLGYSVYYRFIKKALYFEYKNKLKRLYAKNTAFRNALNQTPILLDIKESEEGLKLILSISGVMSLEQLEKQVDFILTYFRVKQIRLERQEDGYISMDLIVKAISKDYKPVKTKPYEIFIGYLANGLPKIINLNKTPHLLIGGDTGTGKSRFLMIVITTLIYNHNTVNFYLSQIRKSDLKVFADTKQVKYIATTLEDTEKMLIHIEKICLNRELKIDRLVKRGIYNIEEYNNYFKNNQLNYIYVILEEFSFYNVDKADNKDIKALKYNILKLIKSVANLGRAYGIFIITALQKPTSDSIPTAIKSQLTTRISFKMQDATTSLIILGNDHATKLKERQCVARTTEENIVTIPFINHKIIMENIEKSIEENKVYINLESNKKNKNKNNGNAKNNGVIDLEVLKDVKF